MLPTCFIKQSQAVWPSAGQLSERIYLLQPAFAKQLTKEMKVYSPDVVSEPARGPYKGSCKGYNMNSQSANGIVLQVSVVRGCLKVLCMLSVQFLLPSRKASVPTGGWIGNSRCGKGTLLLKVPRLHIQCCHSKLGRGCSKNFQCGLWNPAASLLLFPPSVDPVEYWQTDFSMEIGDSRRAQRQVQSMDCTARSWTLKAHF